MDNLEILKLKAKGFCCSQIMVQLVLDLMDRENPELVGFSRGLCMGHGSETGDCGILLAGICILAMMAGESQDLSALLQDQFASAFRALCNGGTTCREITKEYYPGMHPETCGSLLSRAFDRMVELLVENGIDPADPGA